jgi:hypothetical protein
MSRKVFTAGEVLAAADVNSFLMDQTVMSFAGTAARGSAIPTPVEGMAAYLEDSNIVSLYDGSAWKNSLKTTGGILQVVSTTKTDSFSGLTLSGDSFPVTGLTATITPSSTSSKILVSLSVVAGNGNSTTRSVGVLLTFGGSALTAATGNASSNRIRSTFSGSSTGDNQTVNTVAGSFLHSPASTSALTYAVSVQNLDTGTQTLFVNRSPVDGDNANSGRFISTITLMEVSA